jgi:hypothetical protein
MSDGGKGSQQRPRFVSNEDYAARWDAIFSRDKPSEEENEHQLQESEKPADGAG